MRNSTGAIEAVDPLAFWGIGAALGLGMVWAMLHLPGEWFAALAAGFLFLFLILVSGRIERFLLGLLFLAIPINPDFRIDIPGYAPEVPSLQDLTPMLNFSFMDIVLAALYLLWVGRLLTARGSAQRFFWPAGAAFVLGLIGWGALSMVNASDPVVSLFMLSQFARAFLLFLYLANNLKSAEEYWLVARCLVAGLAVESLIVFAQSAAGDNLGLGLLGERAFRKEVEMGGRWIFRAGGTLGHPNALGGYIASVLPLVLALRFAPLSRRWRTAVLAGLGLGSIALILSFSRSGWLAAAIACGGVMAWLFLYARRRARWPAVLGAGLVLAVVLGVFSPQITARWTEDDKGSTVSRVPQTQIALEMVRQHPFLGVGLNNYSRVQYLYDTYVEDPTRLHRVYLDQGRLHNIFLLLAAEMGLVSFLFLGAFLCVVAARGRRLLKALSGDLRTQAIVLGAGLGLAARVLHDAAHTGHLPTASMFWIFAAMLAARPALRPAAAPRSRLS